MKTQTVEDLSIEEKDDILQCILDVMYPDGPDTEWDSDTVGQVHDILNDAGLVPAE